MRPTIPSILPFNPNLHQLLKPLQCQTRFSGRQHLRHLSDFNRFKFQRCEIHLVDSQPEVELNYSTHEIDPTDTCRWDPKNTTSMTHDRLDDQYLFTCSATNRCLSRDSVLSILERRKESWTEFPPRLWHLQVETTGVGQTPAAEPWCDILHFISKNPRK